MAGFIAIVGALVILAAILSAFIMLCIWWTHKYK